VHPLLERARRSVRPSADPAAAATAVTAAVTIPLAPAAAPAPDLHVQQALAPGTEPAHPPVSIGEIHVHVTEPAPAAADPLALLTPYGRGLTARRGGTR
jgi:hypothetical protein